MHSAVRAAHLTRLHRMERRGDQRRFDDAVWLLVTRGIWDLDDLDAAYERRRVQVPYAHRERRREFPAQRRALRLVPGGQMIPRQGGSRLLAT